MRCLLLSLLVGSCAADLSEFSNDLKMMAFNAAWGAANERKYGKDMGSWEASWAKATTHLDAVKEAIDDDTVVNLMNSMSLNSAWGAANERAWGKRSSSQVDWDMFHSDAGKLESKLRLAGAIEGRGNFAASVKSACASAAWWAANFQKYGEHDKHATRDWDDFVKAIAEIKEHAPKHWPVDELQALFKNNAWAASSHRSVDQSESTFMKNRRKENREDWANFDKHSQALKKYLGSEQVELFQHLENMALFSAWGAVNERWYGRRAQSAHMNWEKFNYHSKEGQELYKGPCEWDDIVQMMAGAAWGAANERAYGEKSEEARSAWKRYESHAAKLVAAGQRGGEL